MNDVHKITIQVRAPRGSFAGEIAEGWYVVADGAVVLTDEKGKPIGEAKRQHNPGGDARLIACSMLRARRRNRRSLLDFSAPIQYQRSKYL
jgi:hypothetical protein